MKRFLKGIFVIVFLISVNFFSMFVGPGQILHEKIHFCIKKWKKLNFMNFYKKKRKKKLILFIFLFSYLNSSQSKT